MTPDDPVGAGGQLGVPSPGRRSVPARLCPAWRADAGALPGGPRGAEVLMCRAGLGAAVCASQAGGEGTGHEGRIKTPD